MRSQIIATGSYLPTRVVWNEMLSQFPAASLSLIAEKTGVRARRHAAEEECTSDLAAKACTACLQSAGVQAEEVDAIVLATSSPDRVQPATATRVQYLLSATRAFAFDVNSVCCGGIYALHIGDSFIRSRMCHTVLVVGAEVYSRLLNPRDFSTYPYFGDGAGAALLVAAEDNRGILQTVLHSDGAGADVIQVPAGGSMRPYSKMAALTECYFQMRGKEVFQFAVTRGAEVVEEVLVQTGVARDAITHVVAHQANINVLRELSVRTQLPFERFVVNLDRYGNTAGASVLIALDELLSGDGRAQRGDLALLVAFGGGLSWGASLIRL